MQRIAILLIFIATSAAAQDRNDITQPRPPVAPVTPGGAVQPPALGPGTTVLPVSPPPPPPPSPSGANNQTPGQGQVRETHRYNLTVLGAFPNGDTRNNVASTISSALYVAYSNRTMELRLSFVTGVNYVYYLRNPRSRIETSTGTFRETFDVMIQAGNEFLFDYYSGELFYTDSTVISFSLIQNNRVIVLLNFTDVLADSGR